LDIKKDDLEDVRVKELISEHLNNMTEHSPPESIHALDVAKLKTNDITFWSIWENGELLGCGALKELDETHGEIKSMRTASVHRRKGAGKRMLQHILEEASKRGYSRVSLETGAMEAFTPARKLYENFGFHYCAPFAQYTEDPYSMFMTKEIMNKARVGQYEENYE
jgi:putative acetyltransferase